jgi:hypothetical protein
MNNSCLQYNSVASICHDGPLLLKLLGMVLSHTFVCPPRTMGCSGGHPQRIRGCGARNLLLLYLCFAGLSYAAHTCGRRPVLCLIRPAVQVVGQYPCQ